MKAATSGRPATLARSGSALVRLLGVVSLCLAGCATGPSTPAASGGAAATAESVYGIRVDALHLSAHGYVLDLRYRVLDPVKAAPLLNAKSKVYLIDEARNAKLGIPESPVIGGMRQTSRNNVIYTNRDYFILFVNPGRAVRSGDTLKLAVNGSQIADLLVR